MKKPEKRPGKRAAEAGQTTRKATSTEVSAPRRARKRKIETVIKKLDVSTLGKDQLLEILDHVKSTLDLRGALENTDELLPLSVSNLCYTKSGESPMVSLYRGPFKVGETTETDALARGIQPCG